MKDMIVLLDEDEIKTAAFPIYNIARIAFENGGIIIDIMNGAAYFIPCRDKPHQKAVFSAMTGGGANLILPSPPKKEASPQDALTQHDKAWSDEELKPSKEGGI